MRPPGGFTTDMYNYANDFDIYAEYANMITKNQFIAPFERPYHCAFISRKNHYQYALSHQQILDQFGHLMIHHDPMSPVLRSALGDYCYIVRSPQMDELFPVIEEIQRTRE